MKKDKNISKFIKGELTEQEIHAMDEWLLTRDSDAPDDFMKSVWDNVPTQNIHGLDKDVLYQNILAKTLKNEKVTPRNSKPKISLYRRKNYRIPIIWAILVITASVSYFLSVQTQVPQPVKEVVQLVKETARGYRSSILLRDGSKVTINSESKITYDENFGVTNRTIHLDGEAFFEVEKDPSKPFIVISKNLTTTTIGTSFNVRDYIDEDKASISLATGKVEVNPTQTQKNPLIKSKYTLVPSEQILVDKKEKTFTKGYFDANELLSWKNDILYFHNTRLLNIINTLERWYDVEIRLEGKDLEKLRFKGTGEFPRQSLETVLNTLGYSMGFKSEINGKHILIKLTDASQ